MKQEEKQLLFQDLCARLSYNVIVEYGCKHEGKDLGERKSKLTGIMIDSFFGNVTIGMSEVYSLQPYLRPMSSITEEEVMEWAKMKYGENSEEVKNFVSWKIRRYDTSCTVDIKFFVETEYGQQGYSTIFRIDSDDCESIKFFDWLNAHHFDYRGLIRKKLALPADNIIYSNINKNNE